jgi:predicted nucleic acid-binding Zn ribbon protein
MTGGRDGDGSGGNEGRGGGQTDRPAPGPLPQRAGPARRRLRGIDRGPQPVGEALDDVVRGLARPSRPSSSAATLGTVFSRWEEVVGPAVARHARPLRLETGLLVVAVDQPPWATQVKALGSQILARIGELTGERLERMDVVVRR